jgi:CRISPR/Cas system-associated exonuclease Cas4 (RecB family)
MELAVAVAVLAARAQMLHQLVQRVMVELEKLIQSMAHQQGMRAAVAAAVRQAQTVQLQTAAVLVVEITEQQIAAAVAAVKIAMSLAQVQADQAL